MQLVALLSCEWLGRVLCSPREHRARWFTAKGVWEHPPKLQRVECLFHRPPTCKFMSSRGDERCSQEGFVWVGIRVYLVPSNDSNTAYFTRLCGDMRVSGAGHVGRYRLGRVCERPRHVARSPRYHTHSRELLRARRHQRTGPCACHSRTSMHRSMASRFMATKWPSSRHFTLAAAPDDARSLRRLL